MTLIGKQACGFAEYGIENDPYAPTQSPPRAHGIAIFNGTIEENMSVVVCDEDLHIIAFHLRRLILLGLYVPPIGLILNNVKR